MREREWSEIGEYYDGNMISNIYIYIFLFCYRRENFVVLEQPLSK